jgi:superfamily II DNA/RNA helicase
LVVADIRKLKPQGFSAKYHAVRAFAHVLLVVCCFHYRNGMSITFADLKLNDTLVKTITNAGYVSPTPVQMQSIPAAIEGHDLLVSAQTGSGKTAAFLLPALEKLQARSDKPGKGPRVLVLTPTRELAQQIEKNAQIYGENMKWLRTVTLVGGTSFGYQTRALNRPIDIIVATPGRLMDHMRQGRIDFSRLEMLILDEADRMLDMGFVDDIETIVAATPDDRQTLLFSATLDGIVGNIARKITNEPQSIEIERVQEESRIEEQLIYSDDFRHKDRLLDHILRDANIDQCVIFTATKAFTEQLADQLYEKGYAAECLHGDMPQSWRNRTLNNLRTGRTKILVATDVAARGIDVPTITHVINYDLPKQAEDYVHRIGRTGRAGRSGIAITFAEVKEYMKVSKIERYLKRQLPEAEIAGLEATRRKPKGGSGRNGGAGAGRRGGSNGGYGDKRRSFGGRGDDNRGNRSEGGRSYGSRDDNRGNREERSTERGEYRGGNEGARKSYGNGNRTEGGRSEGGRSYGARDGNREGGNREGGARKSFGGNGNGGARKSFGGNGGKSQGQGGNRRRSNQA